MNTTEERGNGASEPELGALRRAWRGLDKPEPPDLLDQAVLNAARRALAAPRNRRPLAWLGAFATAAVVVLALAIVVQQRDHSPSPATQRSDGLAVDRAGDEAADRARESDTAGPGPAEEGKAKAEASHLRTAPAALETMEPRLSDDGAGEDSGQSEALQDAPPTADPRSLNEETSGAVAAGAVRPLPEAWIERLMQMLRDGRMAELRDELAEFRRAYPDYPLPPELSDPGD